MSGYVDDYPDTEIFKLSILNKKLKEKVKLLKSSFNYSDFGKYHEINRFVEVLYS